MMAKKKTAASTAAASTAAPAAAASEAAPAAAPAASEFGDVGGVLIAAVECAPLVKVGGMADVVGALPKYLASLGVDARVILPFHRQVKERFADQVTHLADFQAQLGWRSQYVGLEKLVLDGVTYYFIDNEFYFGGEVYAGGDVESEQYAFFARAVMDCIPLLDFDVRVLHCNDWHTAVMPVLARTQYAGGVQERLRTVLTIHNLHFQGWMAHEAARDLLGISDGLATPGFLWDGSCDNLLKGGIVFADKVTTVSPTYAREICEPLFGEGLQGVLRSRGVDLSGILNGLDYDVWNPETDGVLAARFSAADLAGKRVVRDALLCEMGLEPASAHTAVVSMVGRLTPQKGIDLVQGVLDELMEEDVRVVILGTGYAEYEELLVEAERRHAGRLRSFIGYDAELSHRIYAGSDLFLMPSLFEPCGISQLIAMRYGTLPIVRETGGLKDTVAPYDELAGAGSGFSFAPYDADALLAAVRAALAVWRDEDARGALVQQAMALDFSFGSCAAAYAELYRELGDR